MTRHPSTHDARKAIHDAVNAGRYVVTTHAQQRIKERGMTLPDLLHALMWPIRLEPYPSMAQNGGSLWRVSGKDVDGEKRLNVGIELYDEGGNMVALCTVFATEKS